MDKRYAAYAEKRRNFRNWKLVKFVDGGFVEVALVIGDNFLLGMFVKSVNELEVMVMILELLAGAAILYAGYKASGKESFSDYANHETERTARRNSRNESLSENERAKYRDMADAMKMERREREEDRRRQEQEQREREE